MDDPAAWPAKKVVEDKLGELLPAAFQFTVSIGSESSSVDSSFQEVSGLELSMEVDELREGGENRFMHQLPTGVKQKRLTLKRGIASMDSPLVGWCKRTLEAGLSVKIKLAPVTVKLLDAKGNPLRTWSFTQAYPVRWEIDNFQSTKNEVALETIEFAYQEMRRSG
ncbi:phage tail protein [Dyella silvae]|uniref:phage tail protein n=1 Tax=Dyella silvae TaxID=2994424 RepID=UPI0022656B33|nr:phage tail protein [Dyella silvae]